MNLHDDLMHIQTAALQAVDPAAAVQRSLSLEGSTLVAGDRSWSLARMHRVFLIGVGKASVPMAEAAAGTLGPYLTAGIVVTKYGHAAQAHLPAGVEVVEAGHPVPDAAGQRGAEAIARLLAGVTADDLVVVLISGGASALLPLPVQGISLADLQMLTDRLLRSGAAIGEINTIRKHLSQLKGGQLARLAAPAEMLSLVLSDVVGDPLDVIASGPTVPDTTTYADAWQILQRYGLLEEAPGSIVQHLRRGMAGACAETPKPGDPLFARVATRIIGSNRLAAQAAAAEAARLGYHTLLLTTFMEGEAREVARVAAGLARGILAHGDPLSPPACLVLGGETTVTVRGTGRGGRNQELALAAALALEHVPDVAVMALATDGTDGPTDAAGAVVDGETLQRARAAGFDPYLALERNDAYPLLDAAGALLRTGPTGTNVNDLLVIVVKGPAV